MEQQIHSVLGLWHRQAGRIHCSSTIMLHLGTAAPSASPKVSRADSGCPKSTLHTTRSTVAILSYKQSLSHYSVVVLPCKTAFLVLDFKPLLTHSVMLHVCVWLDCYVHRIESTSKCRSVQRGCQLRGACAFLCLCPLSKCTD